MAEDDDDVADWGEADEEPEAEAEAEAAAPAAAPSSAETPDARDGAAPAQAAAAVPEPVRRRSPQKEQQRAAIVVVDDDSESEATEVKRRRRFAAPPTSVSAAMPRSGVVAFLRHNKLLPSRRRPDHGDSVAEASGGSSPLARAAARGAAARAAAAARATASADTSPPATAAASAAATPDKAATAVGSTAKSSDADGSAVAASSEASAVPEATVRKEEQKPKAKAMPRRRPGAAGPCGGVAAAVVTPPVEANRRDAARRPRRLREPPLAPPMPPPPTAPPPTAPATPEQEWPAPEFIPLGGSTEPADTSTPPSRTSRTVMLRPRRQRGGDVAAAGETPTADGDAEANASAGRWGRKRKRYGAGRWNATASREPWKPAAALAAPALELRPNAVGKAAMNEQKANEGRCSRAALKALQERFAEHQATLGELAAVPRVEALLKQLVPAGEPAGAALATLARLLRLRATYFELCPAGSSDGPDCLVRLSEKARTVSRQPAEPHAASPSASAGADASADAGDTKAAERQESGAERRPWRQRTAKACQGRQAEFLGKIKSLKQSKRAGYIACDQTFERYESDVFFFAGDLDAKLRAKLTIGAEVHFCVESGTNGRPRAWNLRLREEKPEIEGAPASAEHDCPRPPSELPPPDWQRNGTPCVRGVAAPRRHPGSGEHEDQASAAAPKPPGPVAAGGAGTDGEGRPYDLSRVVVNFANVGTTYGRKVLQKEKPQFSYEGVRRCVKFLTEKRKLTVVGVILEHFWAVDEGDQYVNGVPKDIEAMCESIELTPRIYGPQHRSADDEMTIKCAYRRNCRFLDNDNYRDWRATMHDEAIRSWFEKSQNLLQMRYYFDAGLGSFDTLDGNVSPALLAAGPVQPGAGQWQVPAAMPAQWEGGGQWAWVPWWQQPQQQPPRWQQQRAKKDAARKKKALQCQAAVEKAAEEDEAADDADADGAGAAEGASPAAARLSDVSLDPTLVQSNAALAAGFAAALESLPDDVGGGSGELGHDGGEAEIEALVEDPYMDMGMDMELDDTGSVDPGPALAAEFAAALEEVPEDMGSSFMNALEELPETVDLT
eukprot:TRINITY_DN11124_c1_g2_i1.p1 TRINITY_DN11124_c1_g2~~TRINITY_DN11124_c1_g2_i1.p1  ORF type:complete len:1069 (-),score=324.04 TRINITY_DN11124_c1_g2_i1:95-3301(-)